MKPQFHFSRHVAVLASALLISACGQRGPLYMPSRPAAALPAATTPAAPPAAGAPEGNSTQSPASPSK